MDWWTGVGREKAGSVTYGYLRLLTVTQGYPRLLIVFSLITWHWLIGYGISTLTGAVVEPGDGTGGQVGQMADGKWQSGTAAAKREPEEGV